MCSAFIQTFCVVLSLLVAGRLLTFRRRHKRVQRVYALLAWVHIVAMYLVVYACLQELPVPVGWLGAVCLALQWLCYRVFKTQGNLAKVYRLPSPLLFSLRSKL